MVCTDSEHAALATQPTGACQRAPNQRDESDLRL
jgi:hypothetical protein